jgi:hypothetical protein
MTKILNDICPTILINYDSLSRILDDSDTTKLIVWFQRYLNVISDFTDSKFFLSNDVIIYIITSSLLISLLHIDVSKFHILHKKLHSDSLIYKMLHKRYIFINNFRYLNLKLSLIKDNKSKVNFGKLLNRISKCRKFLNDYVRYAEIKKYDLTPILELSGIITHTVNKSIMSFYTIKNEQKRTSDVQSI